MIHAFVDGSTARTASAGGWGVVLTSPTGRVRYSGALRTRDNGVSEIRAVLEAVRRAPVGAILEVRTDSTGTVTAVRKGSRNPEIDRLARLVRETAAKRALTLSVVHAPRENRNQREAHDLANAGRRREKGPRVKRPLVLVDVREHPLSVDVEVRVTRDGHLTTTRLRNEPNARVDLPLAAVVSVVREVEEGAHVRVRLTSPLTRAYLLRQVHPRAPDVRETLRDLSRLLERRDVRLTVV